MHLWVVVVVVMSANAKHKEKNSLEGSSTARLMFSVGCLTRSSVSFMIIVIAFMLT